MSPVVRDVVEILLALFLVVLNGFFVAAEFALVKVRGGQIEEMIRQRRPFARTAKWLAVRLEASLSACQLGITMASLGLGWIGEPAFAHLLQPLFLWLGITSPVMLHTSAFVVAFTLITSLHLVIGEQAPKIFAIRRAHQMLLWCALPLKLFCLATYPLMIALNAATSRLLKYFGLEKTPEHELPHSEQELRALLREAHLRGSLTGSEHRLINAVFEFDDLVCRRIMVPRNEVDFLDINESVDENMKLVRRTKHTRYPLCDGSLDEVLGVVHVKDLVGIDIDEHFDWRAVARPPRKVPDHMPISVLLRHFQATHQLLAFVIDEYGIIIGIVTLENVLEQIIGDVADEFDTEQPDIVPDGPDQWIVSGSTPVEEIQRKFEIDPGDSDVDTFSGLLTHLAQRLLNSGDEIDLGRYLAEVLETRDDRAVRIRLRRKSGEPIADQFQQRTQHQEQ
ncbi:MAG: membrane protein [Gemmatales bacterium]|nr:MAG: membrane protein [Gemmatales bacterium]